VQADGPEGNVTTYGYEAINGRWPRDEVSIAGNLDNWFEDYTGFSQHHPKAAQFGKLFSDMIREMKQSGGLAEILRGYGLEPDQKPKLLRQIRWFFTLDLQST
jgi:hypothetical protein